MKLCALSAALVSVGILAGCSGMDASKPAGGLTAEQIARQALPANDGWAAQGPGTDGGSKAKAENVYTATNRAELVKALNAGGNPNVAKIVFIKGTVNLSVDDNNKELFEKDYAPAGYDFEQYKKDYAPAKWNVKLEKGRPVRDLTGPQEELREKGQKAQKARILINIPSNTSIIGVGSDAKIVKGNLWIGEGTENVIIRNITFQDAFDYFPQWDPGDSFKIDKSYAGCQEAFVDAKTGPQMCPGGRWNSEYDLISVNGGKRVWIDHCTFNDGDRPDKLYPPVFPYPHNQVEQKVQHHDGLVDITNGGDFVTLSYNLFKDHDKTSLIGGSDSNKLDPGKLSTTYHHNWFDNSGQRLPRVRFGKVHTYNNYITGDSSGAPDPKLTDAQNHEKAIKEHGDNNIFRSGFGIGKDSRIYSENNYFEIKNSDPIYAVAIQGGTVFFDDGSWFNGKPVDLVAAANKPNPKNQVKPDVGWKPTLYGSKPMPTDQVPAYVKANAGAGKL
ncbi:polysaccharide lyase family 1 protein [Uliginosibacterium sp. sgz301328]|uniref:pectate lyase family protein n=1 Tax=Uliginosibacterium sp. sgz301328 TaxID=3243764 RepID=UPI00359DCA6B